MNFLHSVNWIKIISFCTGTTFSFLGSNVQSVLVSNLWKSFCWKFTQQKCKRPTRHCLVVATVLGMSFSVENFVHFVTAAEPREITSAVSAGESMREINYGDLRDIERERWSFSRAGKIEFVNNSEFYCGWYSLLRTSWLEFAKSTNSLEEHREKFPFSNQQSFCGSSSHFWNQNKMQLSWTADFSR